MCEDAPCCGCCSPGTTDNDWLAGKTGQDREEAEAWYLSSAGRTALGYADDPEEEDETEADMKSAARVELENNGKRGCYSFDCQDCPTEPDPEEPGEVRSVCTKVKQLTDCDGWREGYWDSLAYDDSAWYE